MPTAIDYAQELRNLLADNTLIMGAWFDNASRPTILHIRAGETFNLPNAKINVPLASLLIIMHGAPRKATIPRV